VDNGNVIKWDHRTVQRSESYGASAEWQMPETGVKILRSA